MKLLHIVPTYYPAVRYGGPIRSVHALAKGLAQRGHEVHVYTTNVDGPHDSDVPLGAPVEREGVQVWYFPASLGRRLYRSPDMGRALRRNMAMFDIAHLHSVFLWPTSAAAHAARRAGVPYILAPRGMLVADLIRRKSSLAKRAWIGLFERRNIERAAAVHATSQVEAGELLRLGFNPRRIVHIPNGVAMPPAEAGSPAAAGCAARMFGIERPFVLFLGRVNWKKGLDRLIPAMAYVPNIDLIIAGNDEENYQPKLEALARQAPVTARIRFIGPVEGEAKWALLREAQMLVLPSYSENFGMVALEAMAAGCPVIVTPEVGLAPAVRKSGAGLVVEGTPNHLAAAINMLLGDEEQRRWMGAAGRRAARERFSWEAIAREMEQVYSECLPQQKRLEARAWA